MMQYNIYTVIKNTFSITAENVAAALYKKILYMLEMLITIFNFFFVDLIKLIQINIFCIKTFSLSLTIGDL